MNMNQKQRLDAPIRMGFGSGVFSRNSPRDRRCGRIVKPAGIVDSGNNQQGLPQSSVISVIQTRSGYLGLGTLNGLVRFDGILSPDFNQHNTARLIAIGLVFVRGQPPPISGSSRSRPGSAVIKDGVIKNFEQKARARESLLTPIRGDRQQIVFDRKGGFFFYIITMEKMDFNPAWLSTLLSDPRQNGRATTDKYYGRFWTQSIICWLERCRGWPKIKWV